MASAPSSFHGKTSVGKSTLRTQEKMTEDGTGYVLQSEKIFFFQIVPVLCRTSADWRGRKEALP